MLKDPVVKCQKLKEAPHLQTNAPWIDLDIQDYRVYQLEKLFVASPCRPPCNCFCEELWTRQRWHYKLKQSRNKNRAYLPIHCKVIIRKNKMHKFSPSPQVSLHFALSFPLMLSVNAKYQCSPFTKCECRQEKIPIYFEYALFCFTKSSH